LLIMEEFDYADFVSEERVVPEEKLGKYNLPFILFPLVFLFIFVINFGTSNFLVGIDDFFTLSNLFLIFAGGFLLHEALHFLCWQALTQYPIEEFRVGMRWNSFTPVIGCQRPMKTVPFMIGLIFPFVVMGLIPLGIAFYLENTWLLFASVVFMAWASADILTFLLVWNSEKNCYVEMHRKKLGCIVYNPKEEILNYNS
jgi:hypothetical protein